MRLTVNLTKRSHGELMKISEKTGMPRTDVVNRALTVLGLVEDLLSEDDGRLTIVRADGRHERIYII